MLQYLIKFSISLAVLYIFYRAVLRPLTFYQWNRFYLLVYSVLAFFIPFVNINPWVAQQPSQSIINIIPAFGNGLAAHTAVAQASFLETLTLTDWLLLVFCIGALLVLLKFVVQYRSLQRIRRKAVLLTSGDGVRLFETSAMVSPFSFGNAVYFNRQLHTEEELQRIIQHEFVHVKQQHTIDLLLGELLCIVNWFNPFAWLIRHAIRQNLEFIADNNVVANGLDKKAYQYLLLKVVGIPQYAIANHFNFSSLKKRIAMMNKMKSAQLHLTKFLFVLPLLAVLLLAFRNSTNAAGNQVKPPPVQAADTLPAPPAQPAANAVAPPPPPPPMINAPGLPENVQGIAHSIGTDKKTGLHSNTIVVTLKNGSKEKYDLNNAAEKAAYIKKYGNLPSIQPPAAPPPPMDPATPATVLIKQLNTGTTTPLYIVDGSELDGPGALPPGEAIAVINVLKDEAAVAQYGSKAKNGVVIITTKAARKPVTTVADTSKQPLYFVNGKLQEAGYKMDKVNPNDIERVNVWKGQDAIVKYGEQAKNGVVEITTIPPLYVVDGVIRLADFKVDDIDPSRIESINVLKDKNATDKYGEKGKHGVVEITRKRQDEYFPKDVLIFIDGIEVPGGSKVSDYVKPENIESMHVLQPKEATIKYGDRVKKGAIEISTRKKNDAQKQTSPPAARVTPAHDGGATAVENVALGVSGADGAAGVSIKKNKLAYYPAAVLFVVDGKALPAATRINEYVQPENIASMSVLEARTATGKYGKKAAAGAIEITTKAIPAAAEKNEVVIASDNVSFRTSFSQFTAQGKMTTTGNKSIIDGPFSFEVKGSSPLIVYNGQQFVNMNSFSAVSAKYWMQVLESKDAIAKYGAGAKFGAIEIDRL